MANKKRKCRHCKEFSPVETGVMVPLGFFCCRDHALEHQQTKAMYAVTKARASAERKDKALVKLKQKAVREQNTEIKEALKPWGKWLSEAQKEFNAYIRARDVHDGCISCGMERLDIESAQGWKIGGCWDAGHFRTRGAAGHLRFNQDNCHKQCKSCNAGSGKFSSKAATVDTFYRERLIHKIGLERVEALENDNTVRKFSIAELKRTKELYKKLTKREVKRQSIDG